MNSDLIKQASEVVANVHVLVNLVSHRVRQLNAGGMRGTLVGGGSNPSAADIALREIIEGKMSFEMPQSIPLTRPNGKDRNRPKHWART